MRKLSRRKRFARALRSVFYWQGWRTVGALATSVVAIATAVVAIRTFYVSERTLEANTRQQVNEHFAKAIEQLGSDKMDVRLGGIYGLEQLARDSPSEHPAAYDVLEAFVRSHAPAGKGRCAHPGPTPVEEGIHPSPDIQAAIYAIGRRDRQNDAGDRVLDLTQSCLSGANFSFSKDQFTWVFLVLSDLRNAYLGHTHLPGADLLGARLTDADLIDADLKGAYLGHTNLTGANLTGADLSGTDLTGANLTGANLAGANLTGIHYDASTQWPNGFQPPPSAH